MIFVTKSYLPPLERYTAYLERVWDACYLTNRGPLALELEERICSYLDVPRTLFVSNGTIALQIAIKALELEGEIITTPFSYVATTNAIVWENCKPVFVDILPDTYCIDPEKIEAAITPQTSAIMATHVYGYPCEVEAIQQIADKHGLKVIYDAAHAFGVKYKGRSLFEYGDISTVSYHATKLFHTGEGGGIFAPDEEVFEKINLLHTFGHQGDQYFEPGVNGKNSEIHAALGLCIMDDVDTLIAQRKTISDRYRTLIEANAPHIHVPPVPTDTDYNYAYFPVLFPDEASLLACMDRLKAKEVIPRRYFYPSLNRLPYVSYQPMPVSEDVASRVLCLPLYPGLTLDAVDMIAECLKAPEREYLSTQKTLAE